MMSYFPITSITTRASSMPSKVRFAETLEEEQQRSESGTVLKQEDGEHI
jgi:hypothetical protein